MNVREPAPSEQLCASAEVAALEAWHARYNRAIAAGKDAAEAVVEADLTPEAAAEAKRQRDQRDAICMLVPRSLPVARAYDAHAMLGPPEVLDYDEVWLTPHELRRVAIRKLEGEQL